MILHAEISFKNLIKNLGNGRNVQPKFICKPDEYPYEYSSTTIKSRRSELMNDLTQKLDFIDNVTTFFGEPIYNVETDTIRWTFNEHQLAAVADKTGSYYIQFVKMLKITCDGNEVVITDRNIDD